MPSTFALGAFAAAVLALLRADTGVLASAVTTRMYDDVPQRPTYPYLLVEGGSEVAFNTLGSADAEKYGSEAFCRVRVVSQFRGDQEVADIVGAVKAALDGQRLTVSGYPAAIVTFESATLLRDTLAGVTTRELVAEFAITVHQ